VILNRDKVIREAMAILTKMLRDGLGDKARVYEGTR